MAVIIYNCKNCKTGKKVDYPIEKSKGYFYRRDTNGELIPAFAWLQAWGGGKPPVYAGDTKNGLCQSCGKLMSSGKLKGSFNSEVACNAKCINARGHSCECSCGGENHGGKWL